jgi:glycosyltransferase involved in cell wall biosynthesis
MPQVAASLYNLIRLLRQNDGVVLYSLLPAANFLAALASPFGRDSRVVWGVRSADLPLERYSAKTRFAYAAEHALCRVPDGIIVNSQAGMEACRRRGYPDLRLRMISNGFDTGMFRPDAEMRRRQREVLGLRDGEIAIGLPARIDPVKDHVTFLQAAALLLKRDVAARFVCYGGGPETLAKELRERAAELGIAEHILWRGEQSDMPQALNALDIATLCSVSEGFPNAVGEAMACGLACVVTDVGDAGYLVGGSGIVVPPRDPAALAQAWHSLFDPDVRARRGELARARILEHFSVERLAEKTLAVLLDAT